jgi:hypothetical protein
VREQSRVLKQGLVLERDLVQKQSPELKQGLVPERDPVVLKQGLVQG